MSEFSENQLEIQTSIRKSATAWGVIGGAAAGLIGLWLLNHQSGAVHFVGSAGIALIVGFLAFRTSYRSGAKSAQCDKCGAAFSRARSDHQETVTGSEEKEKREEQPDKTVKRTTWTEDTLDVVDTYTCAKCGDETTNRYQTTRQRNEVVTILPAPKEAGGSKKGAASASGAKTEAAGTASTAKQSASTSKGAEAGGGKGGVSSRKS